MFLKVKKNILLLALSAVFLLPEAASAAGYTFTNSISTELTYESNANLAPNDEGPTSDFYLRIAPTLELSKEFDWLMFRTHYTPAWLVYFREQNLNVLTHAFSVEALANLSEDDTLSLTDIVNFRKDSTEGAEGVALQLGRANVFTNTAGVGLSHRFSALTTAELTVSESFFQVEDASGVRKTLADSAAASISVGLTDNTAVNTGYSFTMYRFYSPDSRSNIDSHSGNIGITHHFPYSLDVVLSVGVAYIPQTTDYYTLLASMSVRKSFQKLSMGLDYSRSVAVSTGISSFPEETNRYAVSWDYVFTENTGISFMGTYTSHRSVSADEIQIDQYGATLTGRWHISSNTTLGCGYSYLTQTSRGSLGDDFKRNSIYVGITYTPYQKRF